MLYISHPTEFGTLYSLDELKGAFMTSAVAVRSRSHLDGARLAYALAAEGSTPRSPTLHGCATSSTSEGPRPVRSSARPSSSPAPSLLPHFFTLVKQHGALLAKGRLTGIQFETLFTDGLYLRIARQAINTALKLKAAMLDKGYRLTSTRRPTNSSSSCRTAKSIG